MFSFFAVPILLGDITIDFMQMIDVMVMVMVDIMGEEGEEGDGNNNNNNNNGEGAMGMCETMGNNNNCNNNNNAKRRRKRGKLRSGDYMSQQVDSLLGMFENDPSNVTMIKHYESMAKTHLNKYLEAFNTKGKEPFKISNTVKDVIAPRYSIDMSYSNPNQKKKVVFESLALQFVGRLQESFFNFKSYCSSINNAEEDCAILDTDWSNVLENIK